MKVELIIALGYSGYEKDKEIAKEVPGIDVVVGARSKTFLAKENIYDYYPSIEVPSGPYPTVVSRNDSSDALVVQAYAFAKYIGHLTLNLEENDDGRCSIQSYNGTTILLDSKFQQSKTIVSKYCDFDFCFTDLFYRRGNPKDFERNEDTKEGSNGSVKHMITAFLSNVSSW